MARESLTIEDMSDREFLLLVADLGEDDGWCESHAIVERLDLEAAQSASSRLMWMARYGAVEREVETTKTGKTRFTQRWRLTVAGAAMANGRVRATQMGALDKLDDTQLLLVTNWLTDRARGSGDVARKLIAREWRYGTSPKRNGRVS